MKQTFANQRVTVIGAGRSGQALVRFLLERGATVALSDRRRREEIVGSDALASLPVRLDLGGHSRELFEQADLIAVSPGVPLTIPPLVRAKECGVPLLGEVELAARECPGRLLAVTGTNGKSTTTSLLGEILQRWQKTTFVGGNIGRPLVEACDGTAYDYLAVELSSFQLETIEQFRPQYGLLLNLSEDHLDRYPDLNAYFTAKAQLFKNMGPRQVAILNADDLQVRELTAHIAARKVYFSGSGLLEEGMGRRGEELVWRWQGQEQRFAVSELQLQGEHNIENVMAALIPPLLEGCPAQTAWQAVCNFSGLEHRMQLVRRLDGVDWYNDSKGTNVGSVLKSLAGLTPPVTLIAGGKDKGGEFALLRPLLLQKVRQLILFGEAAERMERELVGACPCYRVTDLSSAVSLAQQLTRPGGKVLLSPACSSFDMFANYAARGEEFVRLVAALPEGGAG